MPGFSSITRGRRTNSRCNTMYCKSEQLFASLGLEKANLSHDEKAQLENLVIEFCGLLALSSAKLGSDTGDHQPIKQLPRDSPLLQDFSSHTRNVRQWCYCSFSQSMGEPHCAGWQERWDDPFCVDYRKLNAISLRWICTLCHRY